MVSVDQAQQEAGCPTKRAYEQGASLSGKKEPRWGWGHGCHPWVKGQRTGVGRHQGHCPQRGQFSKGSGGESWQPEGSRGGQQEEIEGGQPAQQTLTLLRWGERVPHFYFNLYLLGY